MVKKVVLILMVAVVIILSPFWGSILVNDVRLWNFSRQLSKVESLLPEYYVVMAEGSDIYNESNGNHCSYRATKVYRIIAMQETLDSLKKEIEKLVFMPAKKSDRNDPAEVSVDVVGFLLIVFISNGPYDAGFDTRCW
ncbi:MAG: hypothetical protein CMN55_03615 [Sneathiella sp.]|jgi:hypothetical protein|uniref:hypothetical protein n=1 Tax=Sneathiella sp. TaxID=1964365 RepID=UPI000C5CA452|nr:hypothetical protein [Sneathiella sp.]MAL78191.1 hypothetical protein [Sneathiella sp.]|tara:strand:- start:1981 stop:2394 length:414 start_codon:yes stop_codon:yes gene_type:complete